MKGLKGKRVLVTGGASGIGAATARRFVEEGSTTAILDRDEAAGKTFAQELPELVEALVCDVAGRRHPARGGTRGALRASGFTLEMRVPRQLPMSNSQQN